MSIPTVAIGGVYYRVADPDWPDPLDPVFSSAGPGQRWNPPGVPCLYLNNDEDTARANVTRRFAGLPYGPEDLDPATAPLLVGVDVPPGRAADASTDAGLAGLGLPTTYPRDASDILVPHSVCQPVGKAAFDAGLDGVDCRSAAVGGVSELAWFPRSAAARPTSRRAFSDWWRTHAI